MVSFRLGQTGFKHQLRSELGDGAGTWQARRWEDHGLACLGTACLGHRADQQFLSRIFAPLACTPAHRAVQAMSWLLYEDQTPLMEVQGVPLSGLLTVLRGTA